MITQVINDGGYLSRKETPLVISFYTEGTPYQLEALGLISSCRDFGIEAEIEGVPPDCSWERNCALKPFFIRKKLLEKKRPVFWVDCDAIFRKKPDFSFLENSDVSFRQMKRFIDDKRYKYNSASVFFNYTARSLAFVDAWCAACKKQIDEQKELAFIDQIVLDELVEGGQPVKLHPLPISYCKVFDLDATEIEEDAIVIEQFQASRRFKYWQGS